ncbi:MAG: GerAB/ArcD/ProY family transporter [Bacilli bacterium]|nr:GerAB/ArcD/ProY family transporter [Bacilli bacterium]
MKNIKKYVNEYISPYGYMVLVIFLSRSFYSGIGFSNILLSSKNTTWLSLLIGFLIGFIPILIIKVLNNRNINLFEVIHSKTIKFIVIIVLMLSFTILLNDFINFCNVKYLFETSQLFISILIISSSLYIVNKGIETIGRSALFMSFISILLYILISLSLIKYINIDNLKPILINTNIIKSIILFISYTISPIILLSIIPKNNLNIEEYNKFLIIGYIISFISIFIIFFFITTIFNYEYISLFNYPAYFALKKINYNFISNVENIYSLFFIIDYFYSITIYIYIIKYYLKKEYNINNYYVLIIILVYISIYTFKDINIVHFITNQLLHSVLIIFILLFILIPIKKDS